MLLCDVLGELTGDVLQFMTPDICNFWVFNIGSTTKVISWVYMSSNIFHMWTDRDPFHNRRRIYFAPSLCCYFPFT